MLKKEEKDRIKTLISDTVTLLCKNGLNYKAEFSIDAVIGISLDQSEEFFLSIKEMVKTPQAESPAPQSQVDFVEHVRSPIQRSTPAPKRRKRSMLENIKKEANIEGNGVDVDSSNSPLVKADGSQSRADVLPNLSLRDMQENASEYWSSVTGGEEEQGSEDEEETSKHPPAKRHRDGSSSQDSISGQSRPSNSENRTVVVKIKDEPGEEDYEEVDDDLEMAVQGQDSSMNSSLSHDTSGWSQYGSPMAGNKPQQAVQVVSVPGQAGTGQVKQACPSISILVPGQAGTGQLKQACPSISVLAPGKTEMGEVKQAYPDISALVRGCKSIRKEQLESLGITMRQWKDASFQGDPMFDVKVARRVLLCGGKEISPKQVYWNYSYSDRPSIVKIKEVMGQLCTKGLGSMEQATQPTASKRKVSKMVFLKGEPAAIAPLLAEFGVDCVKYEKQYHKKDPVSTVSGTPPTSQIPASVVTARSATPVQMATAVQISTAARIDVPTPTLARMATCTPVATSAPGLHDTFVHLNAHTPMRHPNPQVYRAPTPSRLDAQPVSSTGVPGRFMEGLPFSTPPSMRLMDPDYVAMSTPVFPTGPVPMGYPFMHFQDGHGPGHS